MKINAFAVLEKGAELKPYSFDVESSTGYECIIKVLACGVCHSDLHIIDDDWGMSRYPAVVGHEVVGEIVELGEQIQHLKKGDRVGVGWQASSCLQCRDCLRGNENLCDENQGLIVAGYGGFADYLKVDSRFAFPIPAGIETQHAGPLLCAGITVYSALRSAGMSSGQEIGVIGVGGLGHLAVQFASKLGNRVTAFTTSQDKAEFATQLGAADAIVVPAGSSPPPPDRKFQILISTVPADLDWPAYVEYLDSDGTLTMVGVPSQPLNVPLFPLIMKRRRIMGSIIGGRAIMMDMLNVAEKYGVKPIVETFSMQQANEALQKVRANKVRYRAVLTAN
ncbi:NAD(P)-dependent alcohol dehydrogenase [Ancylothrix sp. C2]|uniref:NAD(P)-dependent alcohol dehydrogenase n=1 Tax=Ancylothrix sp. D3o TaxID=2953691 RepID=UPI0021BB09D4|nr:NAD(P)-dependent alcohol dehydrogenase [Ancylothrix sp. D3o]MCT7949314.1 NAD(P)-dependent alcohol dehydrogenase [Ancylothrix sp. D3o]